MNLERVRNSDDPRHRPRIRYLRESPLALSPFSPAGGYPSSRVAECTYPDRGYVHSADREAPEARGGPKSPGRAARLDCRRSRWVVLLARSVLNRNRYLCVNDIQVLYGHQAPI